MYGFERPLYFRAEGEPALRFGEPPWHGRVGAEVRAAHADAAVFDQSTFGKIRVAGSGAEAFLDRVCANDMTRAPGRAVYTPMLNPRGGYASDLTALRLAPDEYLLYVGTGAIKRDLAWLRRHLQEVEEVTLADVSERHAVLALMGPRAAEIAAALGGGALNLLGRFCHAEAEVAGVPVRAARISYVGEPGWEFTCPAGSAPVLWDAFATEGATPAGLLAQTSMRIEMRYLAMGHDLDGDITPVEAGLDFLVKSRGHFIGADAFAHRRDEGPAKRMVSIVLDDERAWPLGDEPVYAAGRLAGQATSAAFGHRLKRHVALAYLDVEALVDAGGTAVELDIAGERFSGFASLNPVWPPAGRASIPAGIARHETPDA